MKFIEENCHDGELPNGRKTLTYSLGGQNWMADYDPETVERSMAVRAVRRMVEREKAADDETTNDRARA